MKSDVDSFTNINTIIRVKKPYIKLSIIIISYISLCAIQTHTNLLTVKIIILFILGLILCGTLNLAHECLHLTFTKNRRINKVIGTVAAGFLFINYTLYRDFHFKHHRYVGTENDTESSSQYKSIYTYLVRMSGIPLAKRKISDTIFLLFKRYPSYLRSEKITEAIIDSIYVYFFFLIVIIFTYQNFIMMLSCYWLPLFLAYSLIMFFGLPEHYGCTSVSSYYSEARSITTNFLVRFFLWNANFHAEHHLHPSVAGDSLSKIASSINNKIFYREKSYLLWHASLISELLKKRKKL